MAIGLSISEYEAVIFNGLQAAQEPSLVDQAVAIGGSSAQSNAFSASTTLVRLCADASCSVAFGPSPTATLTSKYLSAGVPEYFVVSEHHKVAVIANT